MNAQTPFPSAAPAPRIKPRATDRQFLPAALEIIETPPSPSGIWLLWLICLVAAAAIAWSYVGRLDIVATAPGKIQPTGRVKVIQPLDTGRVASVAVENGQRVAKGDTLVIFDSGDIDSDVNKLVAEMTAYKAEAARRRTALSTLDNPAAASTPQISWPIDVPENIRAREASVLVGDLRKLRSTVASLEAQRFQKQREGERFVNNVAALEELVATLQSRVTMRSTLKDFGSSSAADLMNATQSLQEEKVALSTSQGQILESAAAAEIMSRNIDDAYRNFADDNLQKLADAERKIDDDQQSLDKARLRQSRAVLTSPIAGTVSALSITTVGQVIGAGEEVMRIVPETDAKGVGIEIEAYVQNRDIGFLTPGQEAIVKVESLPFTRYGTIKAKLTKIAGDAIPEADAAQRTGDPTKAANDRGLAGGQATQNLVYPATFHLDATSMQADGTAVPLLSGMSVTVEIKTGSRRILDYLISPLVEIGSESMKER